MKHYKTTKYECIDVINDLQLNFNLGNAMKYIWRAGKKESKSADLIKAIDYLQFELAAMNGELPSSVGNIPVHKPFVVPPEMDKIDGPQPGTVCADGIYEECPGVHWQDRV